MPTKFTIPSKTVMLKGKDKKVNRKLLDLFKEIVTRVKGEIRREDQVSCLQVSKEDTMKVLFMRVAKMIEHIAEVEILTREVELGSFTVFFEAPADKLFFSYIAFLHRIMAAQGITAEETEASQIENSHVLARELLIRLAATALCSNADGKRDGDKLVDALASFASEINQREILIIKRVLRSNISSETSIQLSSGRHAEWIVAFRCVVGDIEVMNRHITVISDCRNHLQKLRNAICLHIIGRLVPNTKQAEVSAVLLPSNISLSDCEDKILGSCQRRQNEMVVTLPDKMFSIDDALNTRRQNVLRAIEPTSQEGREKREKLTALYRLLAQTDFLIDIFGKIERLNKMLGWAPIASGMLCLQSLSACLSRHGTVCQQCLSLPDSDKLRKLPICIEINKYELTPHSPKFDPNYIAQELSQLQNQQLLKVVRDLVRDVVDGLLYLEANTKQVMGEPISIIDKKCFKRIGGILPVMVHSGTEGYSSSRWLEGNRQYRIPMADYLGSPEPVVDEGTQPYKKTHYDGRKKSATLPRPKQRGRSLLPEQDVQAVRRAQTPDVLERPPRASECSRAGHDYGDTVSSDEESSGFQAEHAAYFGASRVDLERVSSPESEESDEYPISEGGTAMRARKKPDTSTTTTTTTATVATKTTAAVTTSTTEITPTPVEWTDSDQKPSSSNLFDDVDLSQETTLSPKEKAVQIVSWKINCEACQGKDAQSREALKQKWRRPKQCSCIQELARQIQLCPEILSDRNPSLLDVAIKHGELAMIDFLFRRGIDPKCSKHCCRWADGQIRAKDNRLVKKLSGYIWRYQEQQIQAQPGNGREDANQQRADRQKALNIIVWKKVDLETEMSIIQWIRGLMGGVTSEHFEEVSTTMLAAIWASMILNDNRFFNEELGKLKESKDKTEQYLYKLLVKGKVGQELTIRELRAENARLIKERDEANRGKEKAQRRFRQAKGELRQKKEEARQKDGRTAAEERRSSTEGWRAATEERRSSAEG